MLASILSTYNLHENSIANLPISNQYNVLLTFATSNLNMVHPSLVSMFEGTKCFYTCFTIVFRLFALLVENT